jgi:hypothetical protein
MRATIAFLFTATGLAACSIPDNERLIRSAIQYAYPSVYDHLSDLRKDYPGFTPRIRRWSDNLVFLFGEGLYAVQMPEEEVLITADGTVKTTRTCGSEGADCDLVPPAKPELGVVGTVQLGDHDYATAENLEITWEGTPGYVYVVGHCFAAFKASAEPLRLSLSVPGYKPIVIQNVFGTRLVAATVDPRSNYYSSMRIPRPMFVDSKACAAQARAAWPNVGGWAWKR